MADSRSDRVIPNPLSHYDILGYILPGAGFLFCIFFLEAYSLQLPEDQLNYQLHVPLYGALLTFSNQLADQTWVFPALFFVAAIAVAYIIGHVVASVSAFVVDATFVQKGHDYPYVHCLGITPKQRSPGSKRYYRGLFFWGNVYVVAMYLGLVYPSDLQETFATISDFAFWLIIATTILKIGSYPTYRRHPNDWLLQHVVWPYLRLFAAPYDAVVSPLASNFLRTHKPFEPAFIVKCKTQFKRQFSLDVDEADTNAYWLPAIYVQRHSDLAELSRNWLRLYGFARNLSTSLYLAFLWGALWLYLQPDAFMVSDTFELHVLFGLPLAYFVLSLVMLARYYYLYVAYYTKYIFRAFVLLGQDDDTAKQPKQ